MAAPQTVFAIHGHRFSVVGRTNGLYPGAQHRFERLRRQARQQPPIERIGRRQMATRTEDLTQQSTVFGAPLPDRTRRVAAAQQRRHQAGQ
jgi:hypothetical protein